MFEAIGLPLSKGASGTQASRSEPRQFAMGARYGEFLACLQENNLGSTCGGLMYDERTPSLVQ